MLFQSSAFIQDVGLRLLDHLNGTHQRLVFSQEAFNVAVALADLNLHLRNNSVRFLKSLLGLKSPGIGLDHLLFKLSLDLA